KSFIILALPLVQLFTLRVVFHHLMKVPIGWPAFTDFDIVLPGVIAFLVLRAAVEFLRPEPLKLNQGALRANGILTGTLVILTAAKQLLVGIWGIENWYLTWYLVAIAMTVAALSTFVSPLSYFRRGVRWMLFP